MGYSEALSKQDRGHVNTILKGDLFTASLNPTHNESPGQALRLNSSDNLTFNPCPQRDNSSLPLYLGREESSSNKACAVLWGYEILCVIIQDSWVLTSPCGCCVKWQAKFYSKKNYFPNNVGNLISNNFDIIYFNVFFNFLYFRIFLKSKLSIDGRISIRWKNKCMWVRSRESATRCIIRLRCTQ